MWKNSWFAVLAFLVVASIPGLTAVDECFLRENKATAKVTGISFEGQLARVSMNLVGGKPSFQTHPSHAWTDVELTLDDGQVVTTTFHGPQKIPVKLDDEATVTFTRTRLSRKIYVTLIQVHVVLIKK